MLPKSFIEVLDPNVAYVILGPMKSASSFPEEVKELRLLLGMSQKELADALGVSYATVNRWEMGRTEPHKLAKEHFQAFRSRCTCNSRGNPPG